jgi:hypothetical protein
MFMIRGMEGGEVGRSERKHETQYHKNTVRLVITVEWAEHLLCLREASNSDLGPVG